MNRSCVYGHKRPNCGEAVGVLYYYVRAVLYLSRCDILSRSLECIGYHFSPLFDPIPVQAVHFEFPASVTDETPKITEGTKNHILPIIFAMME